MRKFPYLNAGRRTIEHTTLSDRPQETQNTTVFHRSDDYKNSKNNQRPHHEGKHFNLFTTVEIERLAIILSYCVVFPRYRSCASYCFWSPPRSPRTKKNVTRSEHLRLWVNILNVLRSFIYLFFFFPL